jgi:hypothetical protein
VEKELKSERIEIQFVGIGHYRIILISNWSIMSIIPLFVSAFIPFVDVLIFTINLDVTGSNLILAVIS